MGKGHKTLVKSRKANDRHSVNFLQDEINDLFENFFGNFGLSKRMPAWDDQLNFHPTVDVKETESEYTVEAELPGVRREDVDISLHDHCLFIKGEKRDVREENEKGVYRSERSFGEFYRQIPLPSEVDEEKVSAKFDQGVLRVTLEKLNNQQKGVRKISISDTDR